MDKRNRIFQLILVASVSFLLIGCGKKETNKKIMLRWSGYAGPGYNEFRTTESKKFEEIHPETIVKFGPIPGNQYSSKILTQIAGGVIADMFFVPGGCPFDYINRGILLDLTDYIEKDKDYFNQIHPHLLKSMRHKGKIYSLPGNSNVMVLYYNKKMFEKAGIPYPDIAWTWNNFLEAAKKLTKSDGRGKIIQFGCVHPNIQALIVAHGGNVWNEEKTKCVINSSASLKALEFYRDLNMKYHVAPSYSDYRNTQGPLEVFLMNRVAMFPGGSWHRAEFKIRKKGQLDWGLVPLPKAEGRERINFLRYLCLGIPKTTKHPQLAYELVKFMIRPEGIRFIVEKGDSLPLRNNGIAMEYFLNTYPEPKEEKEILLECLKNAKSFYNTMYSFYIPTELQNKVFWEHFGKFTLGMVSSRETLRNIENELNKLIETESKH